VNTKTKKQTAKKVVGVDALVSQPDSKWTRFMDMHSGGGSKEKWEYIYIEAPQDEAEIIFYNKFGHNPNRVTCTCCGNDYSISEGENLAQLTAYERNCEWDDRKKKYIEEQEQNKVRIRKTCKTKPEDKWGLYIPLSEYLKNANIKIIDKSQIKPEECLGSLPQQGYVWCD
jgi:hypothetical protein